MIPDALPLGDDNTLLIDNTAYERITTCRRAAQYYILKKRQSAKERPALAFGKIVHKILETRAHLIETTPLAAVQEAMLATADAQFKLWSPTDPTEFRNYDLAVDLISSYNREYPAEHQTFVRDSNGKPLVEVPFLFPLGEIPVGATIPVRTPDGSITIRYVDKITIVWMGRIDEILKREDQIFIRDHKTTTMLGSTYFREFDLSSQFIGYTWAAQELLSQTVTGVIINAIAVRRPTSTGKKLSFERYITTYTPFQISEWITDVLFNLTNFIHSLLNDYFPKSTKWCMGKYGQCEYYDVCMLQSQSERDVMLSTAFYKEVTWSPLKEDE